MSLASPNFDARTNNILTPIISSLADYWKVKGMFIRARCEKHFLRDEGSILYAAVYDFIEAHTTLHTFTFWQNLAEDRKLIACRYFELLDNPKSFRVSCDIKSAVIFVVLSGTAKAIVENADGTVEEHNIPQGHVFGAMGFFNDPFDKRRKLFPDLPSIDMVLRCTMERGSLLRLSVANFRDHIMDEKSKPQPKKRNKTTRKSGMSGHYGGDSSLMGDEYDTDEEDFLADTAAGFQEELTEHDHHCIKARRLAKDKLSDSMYDFMLWRQLLPQRKGFEANKFVAHGNIGYHLSISEYTPQLVYFVLEGSIRVELTRLTKTQTENGSCETKLAKGRRILPVKSKHMPIMSLQAGAILFVPDECFTVDEESIVADEYRAAAAAAFAKARKPTERELAMRKVGSFLDEADRHGDFRMSRAVQSYSRMKNRRTQWKPRVPSKAEILSANPVIPRSQSSSQLPHTISPIITTSNHHHSTQQHLAESPSSLSLSLSATGEPGTSNNNSKLLLHPLSTSASTTLLPPPLHAASTGELSFSSSSSLQKLLGLPPISSSSREQLYRMRLVFEKPTTYIAVPYNIVYGGMRDVIRWEQSQEVSRELNRNGLFIQKKIVELLPWLRENVLSVEATKKRSDVQNANEEMLSKGMDKIDIHSTEEELDHTLNLKGTFHRSESALDISQDSIDTQSYLVTPRAGGQGAFESYQSAVLEGGDAGNRILSMVKDGGPSNSSLSGSINGVACGSGTQGTTMDGISRTPSFVMDEKGGPPISTNMPRFFEELDDDIESEVTSVVKEDDFHEEQEYGDGEGGGEWRLTADDDNDENAGVHHDDVGAEKLEDTDTAVLVNKEQDVILEAEIEQSHAAPLSSIDDVIGGTFTVTCTGTVADDNVVSHSQNIIGNDDAQGTTEIDLTNPTVTATTTN